MSHRFVVLVAVAVAVGVAAAPSLAQEAARCDFPDSFWNGGRIVVTPNVASPGEVVEVSWVPATTAQREAMEDAKADTTWSVHLNDAPLFAGPPPHTIGGYRWDNLVVPADALDGPGTLSLQRGSATVWTCPLVVEGGVPPTTATTTTVTSASTRSKGAAAPADAEGDEGPLVPLAVAVAAAVVGALGAAVTLRRRRGRRRP